MFTGENIVIAGWVSSWALSKDTGREMSCSCDGSTGVVQDRVEFVRCWWRVSLELRRGDTVLESQRDSAPKPKGCAPRATLGSMPLNAPTPTGLWPVPREHDATPLGLKPIPAPYPR